MSDAVAAPGPSKKAATPKKPATPMKAAKPRMYITVLAAVSALKEDQGDFDWSILKLFKDRCWVSKMDTVEAHVDALQARVQADAYMWIKTHWNPRLSHVEITMQTRKDLHTCEMRAARLEARRKQAAARKSKSPAKK